MAWVSGALGQMFQTAGLVVGNLAGDKLRKDLQKSKSTDPIYTESPYVKQRLGLAQTLLNAKMPGSQAMENQILTNQANTTSNLQRNATDSSQLLALGAGVQGQTNDAFNKLGIASAGDYYNRLANLTGAQEGATEEHRSLFDDAVRRWQDKVNIDTAKYGIRMQQAQALIGKGKSVSSSGDMGIGGMMGGGK